MAEFETVCKTLPSSNLVSENSSKQDNCSSDKWGCGNKTNGKAYG